ncbi:MAG: M28 family peptidase [Bacteroidales bacterium]
MKRIPLLIASILIGSACMASSLVLIPTNDFQETKQLFQTKQLNVHFFNSQFVIATSIGNLGQDHILLDSNPWKGDISYYLAYFDENVDKTTYIESIEARASILHARENLWIIKTDETKHGQLLPAKNDGLVRIFNSTVSLPIAQPFVYTKPDEPDTFVESLLDQVSGENITTTVQHLEDYGTRDAYTSQSVEAQEWIATELDYMGLDVEQMSFTMPSGSASDNVIATLQGTEHPDEYVVVGGHYDSVSSDDEAPGADDNASGTAAVLEIARVLSQYDFDRSIIFCAFSGEEYGLYGSAAYASRSSEQGMNILGYFNLDMIGYLEQGNKMTTTLIYPESAKPLADFYTSVTSIYLPDFVVETGSLTGGDSDHTSFNNNGYMGIFPFENINAYSPYIHTADDIVGLSYNSEEQSVVFTKAALASVVTLANQGSITSTSTTPSISFNIFPNPASNYVRITNDNGEQFHVEVLNALGQRVLKQAIKGEGLISTSSWHPGIYFLRVSQGNHIMTKKIVIQR